MDGRLNSSKSNQLPEYELYFAFLAETQYFLYEFKINCLEMLGSLCKICTSSKRG